MLKKLNIIFSLIILTNVSSIYSINEPTGIQDAGKTSYINAVLQCLHNIPQMTEFISKHKDFYIQGSLGAKYANFLGKYKASQNTKNHNFSPDKLLTGVFNLENKKGENIFFENKITDAYKFLNQMLKHLMSKDVNQKIRYYGNPYQNKLKTRISEIFNMITINDENINEGVPSLIKILKLPFDKKFKKLEESLGAYFKKHSIVKFPKILTIKLDIFMSNGDKIKTPYIDAPITNLDLSQYISISPLTIKNQQPIYDLIGIVAHKGDNANYGHYMAYASVKEGTIYKWYSCNDSTINEIKPTNENSYKNILAQDRTPYLLFYQQRPQLVNTAVKIMTMKELVEKLKVHFSYKDTLKYSKKTGITLTDLLNGINDHFVTEEHIINDIETELQIPAKGKEEASEKEKGKEEEEKLEESLETLKLRLIDLASQITLLNLRDLDLKLES